MGNIIGKWRWGGDPDIPNVISGLTLRDIYLIQKSWQPVHVNAYEYGLEMFKRLFKTEPEAKNLFVVLEDYNHYQIAGSNLFKSHVINFMSSFDITIKHLSQPEAVIDMMHKLGEAHPRHHVSQKYFPILKDVMIAFLIDDLKLDNAALASWRKLFDFIFPHIFSKMTV